MRLAPVIAASMAVAGTSTKWCCTGVTARILDALGVGFNSLSWTTQARLRDTGGSTTNNQSLTLADPQPLRTLASPEPFLPDRPKRRSKQMCQSSAHCSAVPCLEPR